MCVCVPSYLNENELLGDYKTCMEQSLAITVMNPTKGDHSNSWSCLINLALSLKGLGVYLISPTSALDRHDKQVSVVSKRVHLAFPLLIQVLVTIAEPFQNSSFR